jgi:5-methylcytosine-specific restriction protein A
LEIWPVIKTLHFEFINKVAAKYDNLKKTTQVKHSSSVINYLHNESGQFVPSPIYERKSDFIENNFALPEEISDDVTFYEGSKQRITVNAYERNSKARKASIAHYGTRCRVCKLDFGEKYGEVGQGFIHVHHLKPLSDIGEKYEIDPKQDLIPVCPNCHAIIHKRNPPYTIEEVKMFLK